jgi:GTP-binding protein HflX
LPRPRRRRRARCCSTLKVRSTISLEQHPEKAILAGFERRRGSASAAASESFRELAELATSAGAAVIAEVFQVRPVFDAATLLGYGKVQELKELAAAHQADVLIVDHELTPTQQRNLESAVHIKVIDRTQLILDIFAHRARTAEGRLQVELAQLKYMLPRLSGQGVSLSRLGGGIGTRGPGETKLETDRRRISTRIKKLERDLERVRTGRALHRENRGAIPVPTVSLAGYTNAGKSTLFNRLTAAGVLADARMFATLDPTIRSITLPSRRRVLLSDTVGFVRNLPTTLIEAFRATLEEVADASLILHVVDVSSAQAAQHISEVFRVLGEIGASSTPQILVLNKADRLQPGEHPDPGQAQLASQKTQVMGARLLADAGQSPLTPAVMVSGLTGEGLANLFDAIDEVVPFDALETVRFRIPLRDGASIALLHERGRVLAEDYDGSLCEMEVDAPESLRRRLSRYLVSNSTPSVENSVYK